MFGGTPDLVKTYQVKTRQELEELFGDEEFASATRLQFVELYMPKEDAPMSLRMTAKAAAKTNAATE